MWAPTYIALIENVDLDSISVVLLCVTNGKLLYVYLCTFFAAFIVNNLICNLKKKS